MTCIFCQKPVVKASVSHILPASLGGEEWACLPQGLVCSKCNQYFGEKVENHALANFPFLPFRVFLGIPTRKKTAPQMPSSLGIVRANPNHGCIGLEPPNEKIEGAINNGRITQFRILAEPVEPVMVCRMLVKMGLEVVAVDSPDDARSHKFDSARMFARSPARGMGWWFFIKTSHAELFSKFRNGISIKDWINGVSLSIHQFNEFEVFRLQLLDMVIFTPLDARVLPPEMSDFPEPDHRLFKVRN